MPRYKSGVEVVPSLDQHVWFRRLADGWNSDDCWPWEQKSKQVTPLAALDLDVKLVSVRPYVYAVWNNIPYADCVNDGVSRVVAGAMCVERCVNPRHLSMVDAPRGVGLSSVSPVVSREEVAAEYAKDLLDATWMVVVKGQTAKHQQFIMVTETEWPVIPGHWTRAIAFMQKQRAREKGWPNGALQTEEILMQFCEFVGLERV